MIYLIAIVSAISGFLFGYDEGIIAGSLHILIKEFSMTHVITGLMTSALPFGAIFGSMIIGSLLTGRFSRRIGRRPLLAMVACLYILGGIGISIAPDSTIITVSRVLLGLAIGGGAIVTPLFISETAPANIRGKLVTVYQLAVTIGILMSYCVNYVLVDVVSWRIIYATVILPAILLLIGIAILPESPRWLVLKGSNDKAKEILQSLRKGESQQKIDTELTDIRQAVDAEKPGSLRELFTPFHLPIAIIGVTLFMLQQLSGINTVIYYAPTIFSKVGFESVSSQILATVIIGLVNFLTTILAMYLVDRLGRYYLLLMGFAGTSISLAIIFFGSLLHFPHMDWVMLFALLTYIVSFAISLGPLPYVIMSEIFPINIRGAGMSLSSMSNWFFNALVVFIFPVLSSAIGIANTFSIFALLCFLGLIFTIRYVPETKGISLEEIEKYINSGKPINQLGRGRNRVT